MGPDEWREAYRLYEAMADVPEAERRGWLDSAGAKPEVAAEVLAMLAQAEESRGFAELPRGIELPRPAPGSPIGKYVIETLLGHGAMGDVFAARDSQLDRKVALKLLNPERVGLRSAMHRFLSEAKAVSALNHPNIVTVYEVLYNESAPAIAMELVDGQALRQFCRETRGLDQVMHWGQQIASALAAAHARGIVHRDVKPENIMVRPDGLIKVLDFGLAREVAGGNETSLTGLPVGTLRYMSPEQTRGEPLTGASDIFSLGIVLYELATGRHPFPAESPFAAAHAIATSDPAPPSSWNREIPANLEELLWRMLEKDPQKRPAAEAVAERLAEIANRPGGRGFGALKRRSLTARNRGWLVAAGVATIGAAIGLAAVLMRNRLPSATDVPEVKPFTSLPGSEISPAFSPDGGRVAFAWNGNPNRKFQICVQAVGSYQHTQLTSAPTDSFSPAWSPSGNRIAFLRRGETSSTAVMLASADGGSEKEIATLDYGDPPWNRTLSWSPDGRFLVSTGNLPGGRKSGVLLISVDSGKISQLTHAPDGGEDMMPAFSVNGRAIAFVRDTRRTPSRLEWLPLKSDLSPDGDPQQLGYPPCTTESQACLDPSFIPQGAMRGWIPGRAEIVFTVRSGGATRLWRAPVPNGPPRLIQFIGEGASQAALSPAGDGLVYQQVVTDFNIWTADLSQPEQPALAPAIVSTQIDTNPSVSPDGRRVLFESTRSGHQEIWVSGRDGSDATPLTSFGGPVTGSPRWSPDATRITFDTRISGQPQIYTIDADGRNRRQLTSGAGGNLMPSWSSDGQSIYFTSQRSGSRQVWKVPSAGGEAIELTHNGGGAPFASSDGRTVYYMKTTNALTSLWQVPEDGGQESQVIASVSYRNAAPAPHGIYYFAPLEGSRLSEFDYLDLATGRARRIFSPPKPIGVGISLTPDFRYLFYTQLDTEESDLRIVQNFR